nr:DNA recombination protein RmuC [Hydromonas duriensis]
MTNLTVLLYIALMALFLLFVMVLLLWQRLSQAQNTTIKILQEMDDSFEHTHQLYNSHGEKAREFAGQLAHQQRDELGQSLFQVQTLLNTQLKEVRENQSSESASSRETLVQQLNATTSQLMQQLQLLNDTTERRLSQMRENIEHRLSSIEQKNEAKLEQMRQTVDEKLHATLEARLGESFKLVSERLEQVHKGLGEMQTLASGVGDLKRVLTNVKTRGTWGEMQLANLLEQIFTPEQYAANVATVPESQARVEFALKLPGRTEGEVVWLPIDAKFPKEQYERMQDAQDAADAEGVELARVELVKVIRNEAKTIAEKYVSPPHTTDFAILFLPTEGLYAEVARQAGLLDVLQREHRVVIAGPTTLMAILNSLHMGFRTLAMEKRASDVWQVLGAVKTEFGKFGDVLAKTRDTLEKAAKNIDAAQVRTRAMNRALTGVEQLNDEQSTSVLALGDLPVQNMPDSEGT